ncbi:MAG: ABC-type multidrug transport system, ATpase component [Haloplasmataceae bacterium]|jgi:ABC-2 type transport system ATP-binding protein|nr:ABC-type multidrug transport system, ATpase component [Haloplasmataceae bacterium]
MIVKLENVTKTYKSGVKALHNLSYEVREGEIYGLLGPNGSGKTTSINCLLSLLKFESGNIEIFGEKMTPERYDIKSKIGVVPQNVAVFEELTVYENIDYFCGLYVPDQSKRKQLVEEAIDFVSLNDYRKFYPKKLSGGLIRRLNIACGIAHKPSLIIFDEPTVAVDPQSRNKILEGILKLNEQGATIIYTSHYMEEVEQICDYIVIMDKGEVIKHGTKEELKNSISLGETIEIQVLDPKVEYLDLIKAIPNVFECYYKEEMMVVKSGKGKTNIPQVLNVLSLNEIKYGKMYSSLPTLNDVFLEITGKQLRD